MLNKKIDKIMEETIKSIDVTPYLIRLRAHLIYFPEESLFVPYEEFVNDEILEHPRFETKYIVDKIRAQFPPIQANLINEGTEPYGLVQAVVSGLICYPRVPKRGVWWNDRRPIKS